MTAPTELRNGRIVTPNEVIESGRVVFADRRITHVGAGRSYSGTRTIDVGDRMILPGLVDLHGDDVEQHLFPRSGARVDVETALAMADRSNLFNGVTTKFHAVAFEDAPGDDRTFEDAKAIARELAESSYTLADNRLHARCELSERSVAAVERVAEEVGVDLLSVMHHAPEEGQFDRDDFERHYLENRDWSPESVDRAAAARDSLSRTERDELVARVVDLAGGAAVPLASHDDDSAAMVDRMFAHGAAISEYPVTEAAARRASELGMTTAMGAPNLVRGGSLWDNLSARDALDGGYLDVLCSDYHPPSLLAAPFVDTGEPLPTRVNRVTKAPADAAGLSDRGRIEAGARADLLVVDPGPPPTVERVFVAGTEALTTNGDSGKTGEERARPLRHSVGS